MAQDPGFVQKAFAAIADRYVVTNHILSLGTDVWWRKKVAHQVAKQGPALVLDIATGSGDLAAEVQRKLPQTTILAADFCQPMLRHARKRALRNLLVADGMRLPFASDTFDAVTVAFGLRNMASWEGAARELARVLKPGGVVYILDFSQPAWGLVRVPYLLYLNRVLPWLAGRLTGDQEAYDYLSRSIASFPSGKEMCALLNQNGLCKSDARSLTFGIASLYTAQKV